MAGLNHPNACRVLEVCIDPPPGISSEQFTPFIVMEWVDGQPLNESWKEMSLSSRLRQFTQIVEATAAIHAAGLVHQDIKPSNILVDRRGQPVIVDFGLARTRDRGAHLAGGTPGWAAPEQIRAVRGEDATIDARADIFALGVILYELLTDRLPFEAATVDATLERTLNGVPDLPEHVNPCAPAILQRICLAAIDPVQERRYHDAGAMLADLRRHAAGETVVARPTILLNRFAEQIDVVAEQVERWSNQELIAANEARTIRARLADLQRPESPWILDSRRLSGSQVALYLGGWMIVLSLTIGVWHSHSTLVDAWKPLSWIVPTVASTLVLLVGLIMHLRGHRRASLAFLITTSLCLPATAWQGIRSTSLMVVEVASRDQAKAQLFGEDAADYGLQNLQLAAVLSIGVVGSVVFRLCSRSSAFSLLACIFAVPWWMSIWLSAGRLRGWEERTVVAELGVWLLGFGVTLLASGTFLSRREEFLLKDLGPTRFRTADAWPLVAFGTVALIASLSTLAWSVPELLLGQSLPSLNAGDTQRALPSDEKRAGAFLIVGLLLLALGSLLSRRPTSLLDKTSRALRWITPSYILLPMAWLEYHNAAPGWGLWFVLLAATSLASIFASAALQWKPYLLTGLIYLAEWYVRAFDRIRTADSSHEVLLLASMGIAGLAVMLIAWLTMRDRPHQSLKLNEEPSSRANHVSSRTE